MSESQQGQSYIEVIVVILLISIALVGMVSTIVASQQLRRNTIYLSDAVNLAREISNRMSLNSIELIGKKSAYLTVISDSKKMLGACDSSAQCQSVLQAKHDLSQWQMALAAKLPNYSAIICKDSSPNDGESVAEHGCDAKNDAMIAIKIWWLRDDNKYIEHQYSMVHPQ